MIITRTILIERLKRVNVNDLRFLRRTDSVEGFVRDEQENISDVYDVALFRKE